MRTASRALSCWDELQFPECSRSDLYLTGWARLFARIPFRAGPGAGLDSSSDPARPLNWQRSRVWTVGTVMELSPLIKKLGHQLVEIRVRALKNILCKIDHGLVSVVDLAQEKNLFIRLLEWFNFPTVPMQEEVLSLCNHLVKHSSVAQLFREIGALEFLAQLRSNVEPKLQACIDEIMDDLFRLPDTIVDVPPIAYQSQPLKSSDDKAIPPVTFDEEMVGYFQKSSYSQIKESRSLPQKEIVNDTVKCLKYSTFPWLTLTMTDKHVLSSTASSLKSSNHTLVRNTCELLQDVIMQDFPAEIFLQRPKIVQNLLLLTKLAFGDGQDGDAVSSSASSSQRFSNSGSPLSNHSIVDLANLELPEMESEDSLELQFQQLTLPQFCVAVLEHGVPLLRTGHQRMMMCALELLFQMIFLLDEPTCQDLWNNACLVGQGLMDNLMASLGALGETLNYHHMSITTVESETAIVHHRLAFISIALLTVRLLQIILPVEKARKFLPQNLGNILYLLSVDLSFRFSYLSVHESVTVYLEQISQEHYAIYKNATEIIQSMENVCTFLRDRKGEHNPMELIEFANHALVCLPYHQQLEMILRCVEICSKISKSVDASPLIEAESQKILLKLLSHAVPIIKAECYRCCLKLVKVCLRIHNVIKPVLSSSNGINFLLHAWVLYEICTFGLQDPNQQVNSAAKEILIYLLQSRLIMSTFSWNKLIEALYPVIPILQGFASTEDPLGKCILGLSEPCNEDTAGILSRTARIRASLRLFMSKLHLVRSVALTHLMPHLVNEEDASNKLPVLQGSISNCVSDLYILEKSIDLQLDTGKSIVKEDNACKVCEILISETVDLSLRKSAAEQLAVMAQDAKLHAVLKRQGIVEKIVSFAHESVHRNGKCMQCLVLPCLAVLRKLVYLDPALRHTLALQTSFLLTLFRVSLVLQKDKEILGEVAALLTLLLFDEVARIDYWPESITAPTAPFSLPAIITQRYNLMVKVPIHHAVSPYCTVVPSTSNPMNMKPVSDMLKVGWNLAWYGGIDQVLDQNGHTGIDISPEFLENLKLSCVDIAMLKTTYVTRGLQECLVSITEAVSHSAVSSALARMRLYLLNDKLALKQGTDSTISILHDLEWQTALSRFLLVLPACVEDEKLLADVLAFLSKMLKAQRDSTGTQDLNLLLEVLLKQETNPLMNLLLQTGSPVQGEMDEIQALVKQKLQKELTGFFNSILQSLTSVTSRKCLLLAGPFRIQLSVKLLQCLRITNAPHFYGLPALERTLRGMVYVTAIPGWTLHSTTEDPYTLCKKYLMGLLEVISSFYVEWGGNAMSFMGKGVTKSAVICLLQLSYEMRTQAKEKDWISLWSLADEQNNEDQMPSRLGLAWLIPLWVDRDPEVRFGSLGIGSALTLVENGCIAFAASCQNISGGLWGTVLNILLDQSECSMARKEAASILQNLLMIRMPATLEEAKNSVWQSPCVHDEESGLSLVGLPALQALLYHCQFYERVAHMAKQCYLGRYMFDLNSPKPTGRNFLNSNLEDIDSLEYWRTSSGLSNHSHLSSFPSTSSTLILPSPPLSDSTPDFQRQLHDSAVSPILIPDSPSNRLTAQGQSDSETTQSPHSGNSHVSDPPFEQCAVITLHFSSALCGLLANLLATIPEDTLNGVKQNQLLAAFHGLVNTDLLDRCLWELGAPLTCLNQYEDIKAQILSHLQYLSAFSNLVQHCLVLRPEHTIQDDLLKPLLLNIFTVLCIQCKDYFGCEVTSAIYQAWTDLFMLLNTILRKSAQDTFPAVVTAVAKHWAALIDTISLCIEMSTTRSSGLVDSCIEQIKHTYVQFNLASLRPGKVIQRKKDDSLTRELKMVMQLLRNCLYHNVECKVVASDAHLGSAIYRLWPWFLMDDMLMLAALKLLCVYTANLPASCVSLCCGSGAPLVSHSSQRGMAGNSLVHMIMKLVLQKTWDNSAIQQMAFAVLSNLAVSHECKGVMQKSNFLQNFLALPLPKTAGKPLSTRAMLWLKLLLNISFEDEGQQIILKMNGSLELLTAMSQHKHKNNQTTALLVLHNICFNPANKPKVLANDKTMSVLAACLESENHTVQAIGASALWALLHNYQKAKVTLKNPSIKRRVDEANFSLKKCNLEGSLNIYLMKCLKNLAILLNS
ncbi:hypothetical protein chiPu_0003716 [Chiloscyllium punctatum]|uniref:Rotatin N-terminal domain-containing protein n=1 Tax=Chiloscyllium punctatum TaxID=137246 RepID=A0A401S4H7_CHIPU|nr:hypothetical protein [Chiloscyllium punctatum]